jgi:transcription termination/antitermination protein NusG
MDENTIKDPQTEGTTLPGAEEVSEDIQAEETQTEKNADTEKETAPENEPAEEATVQSDEETKKDIEEAAAVNEDRPADQLAEDVQEEEAVAQTTNDNPDAKWYVVHTFSGHENRVATSLKQRIESEHLEAKILDILVPTQDKIEIRGGKKEQVKEKIFPGYILVKMVLDDLSWLAVRTTQGVTGFVGMSNKPTPIPEREVQSIVKFMTQGAAPTFKDVFLVDDTVRIIDGPFADFIGKVETVDKEKGKVRVLVSIFGRETPVELDFLQVTKL